jgi:hypothetical protein
MLHNPAEISHHFNGTELWMGGFQQVKLSQIDHLNGLL